VAAISAKDVKALREQTGAGMMDCKKALGDAGGDSAKAVVLLRERGLAKAGKREGRATSEGLIAVTLDGASGGMVELGCETDFVARTDAFSELAQGLAQAVVNDAVRATPEAVLDAVVDGEKVRDSIAAAVGKLGENVVLKRVARLEVPGGLTGGYVHAGGRLAVLIALEPEGDADSARALAKDLAMHVAAVDPTPVAVTRDGVPADLLDSEREIYRRQAVKDGKPEKVIDRIVEGKIGKYLSDVCLVDQAFVKDPEKSVGDLLGGAVVVDFKRFKLGETEPS
jgi:elongation factor Ts